ncbi:hypothetical protein VZT92_002824 [Zoarces viviparus]|uniref:Uncharacterized protein n=1 Tax=Zoarces viviparus TaxID=48416 RepID=A0AAW1FZP3_ZOAVI
MNGRGDDENGGAMAEKRILPIWTLGDPHNASRHKSVTTSSSFMVVFRLLARRHISLWQQVPTRTLPSSHTMRAHGVIPGSLRSVSSSADALSSLLRCACRYCCCWTGSARRGLPRNTDETREGTESSRLRDAKQRL